MAVAVWQLWGTGISMVEEQDRLSEAFRQRLATSTAVSDPAVAADPATTIAPRLTVATDPSTAATETTIVSVTTQPPAQIVPSTTIPPSAPDPPPLVIEHPPAVGEPIGILSSPDVDILYVIVEGAEEAQLRSGPGHWRGSPLPGQPGNSIISGHRTTYGAPFWNLGEFAPGDRIVVETTIGIHTYQVVSVDVVDPGEVWVARPLEGAWLTLTTCNPKFSDDERLAVSARLIAGPNVFSIPWPEPAHGEKQ